MGLKVIPSPHPQMPPVLPLLSDIEKTKADLEVIPRTGIPSLFLSKSKVYIEYVHIYTLG